MDNDPYDDAHTHYDYHEAKIAIETYAKLVEAKMGLDTPATPVTLPAMNLQSL